MTYLWDQSGGGKSIKERIFSSISFHFFSFSGLFFPLLLPFAPLIFIIIKFIGVVKPKNQILKAQSTLGSRGESLLEAAPQFAMQCYIVFSSMTTPGWIKCTSALALSLRNIGDYVSSRLEEKKEKTNKHCEVLVSCSDWVDWIDYIELHACDMLSEASIGTACQL